MQIEDFNRAVKFRRRAVRLGTAIEARQAAFAADGDALAAHIREKVEAPLGATFTAAVAGRATAVDASEQTIEAATYKAVSLTILALLATAWAITWPVRRLTISTRRLAAGDLATRVARGGASEIDELANAFNHMATELADAERAVKTYQAQLEHRVEPNAHCSCGTSPSTIRSRTCRTDASCSSASTKCSVPQQPQARPVRTSPCCSWTSTISSRSTTRSATSSATGS